MLLVAALIVLAVILGFPRLQSFAAVGCSYKAKALASALFVSGLDTDPERAPEIADEAYRLMRLFRTRVDREKKTVTVSFFGLQPKTAAYRPGLGATLTPGPLPPPPAWTTPEPAAELPRAEAAAIAPILDAALTEPNPRRLRRTRAVVVLRDGAILGERYAPGITATTPLNGWSMTKSVMGALIGTLVAEGKLRLGDKHLLAEWNGAGDPRGDISLEDLLRMSSGLRFSEVYSDTFSDVTRMIFDSYDAAGYAAARPLESAPGTAWKYTSGTSNILSLIARRAVGDARLRARDGRPGAPRARRGRRRAYPA